MMRELKVKNMKSWVVFRGKLYETYVYKDQLHRSPVQYPIVGEFYFTVIAHEDVRLVYDEENGLFHQQGVDKVVYAQLVKERNQALMGR